MLGKKKLAFHLNNHASILEIIFDLLTTGNIMLFKNDFFYGLT